MKTITASTCFTALLALLLSGCGSAPSTTDASPSTGRRALSPDQLYVHCRACHGADGLGINQMHPPLQDSPYLADDEAVVRIILHGFRSQGWAGIMTGFDSRFSDDELVTLINWMRERWTPAAEPIELDTVRSIRGQGPRRQQWTPAELSIGDP